MSRLIDADKLIEELKKMIHPMSTSDGAGIHDMEINAYDEAIVDVMRTIDEQPTANDWIPCSERMPEERDSIFKKFKCTDKWRNAMFEKMSDNVNVTVEFEGGTRMSMKGYTVDGKWKPDTAVKCKVIAWMPLPEPYRPEE